MRIMASSLIERSLNTGSQELISAAGEAIDGEVIDEGFLDEEAIAVSEYQD